jgi:hypothetical protein
MWIDFFSNAGDLSVAHVIAPCIADNRKALYSPTNFVPTELVFDSFVCELMSPATIFFLCSFLWKRNYWVMVGR